MSIVHYVDCPFFCRKLKNVLCPPVLSLFEGIFIFSSNLYPDFLDETEIRDPIYIPTSIKIVYVISGPNGHPKHRRGQTDINSPILCGNSGVFPEEFQRRTDLSLKVAHSSVGPSHEVPDISSQTMEDIYSAIDSS